MICYLESKSNTKLKICSAEKFAELTEDQRTSVLIDAYRSGQNPGAKQMLPAFVFQGYDPKMLEPSATQTNTKTKTGSRKKSALKPTGLVMHDFDHISLTPDPSPKGEGSKMTPQMVYDRFLAAMPKLGLTLEDDLALAHITPSGDGLRLVLSSRKNRDVAEDQKWIADALGVECDVHVKDLSRLSFTPKREDILYINKSLLFAEIITPNTTAKNAQPCPAGTTPLINPVRSAGTDDAITTIAAQGDAHLQGSYKDASLRAAGGEDADSPGTTYPVNNRDVPTAQSGAATSPSVTPYGATAECGDETDTTTNNRAASTTPSFPECYNGIPYRRIVEELILLHGGEPQVGNRENTIFRLASDLAKITDRSAPWLESLIPTFGLPEQEWRNTIAQVCKKPIERGLSRKLQEAIKRCKDEANFSNSLALQGDGRSEGLPPKMPENLPSLVKLLTSKVLPHQKPAVSAMIFPALATHVNDCLFKLRDNTDVELSLMCCLLAQQSVGKGCVKPVLKQIMADIKAQDRINRERERQWQESQKNKKANEKGQSKPEDLVIRYLSSDTTPAAFLGRLFAAEHGDGTTPNLCTYSQVDEIEDLYRFCASGGKNMVQQMIKRTWDRDDIGAERFTANAANIATVLRWNWAASSTIEGGRKFFKNCLTDGTTSRVDFCTIIQPDHVIDFCYGDYDEEFERQLSPYIDRLTQFRCAKTDSGRIIPCCFPEIRAIEERMNDYINHTSSTMPDSTWENYAWRAKIMAIKKLIILYIANGCQWEDEFDDFVWWSFHYSMWCKLNLFYDAASAQFADERITGQRGNRSPLKAMTRTFTLAQFAQTCQQMQVKQRAIDIIYKYKHRGVIVQNPDDTFTISPDYAEKFAIK